MKNHITETQLDNVTHATVTALKLAGIHLGEDTMLELNEKLNAFLYEECNIETVPDDKAGDNENAPVYIQKSRRINCSADEDITYEIDRQYWTRVLAEADGDMEEALRVAQGANEAVRVDYSCEVDEVNAEFDTTVEDA